MVTSLGEMGAISPLRPASSADQPRRERHPWLLALTVAALVWLALPIVWGGGGRYLVAKVVLRGAVAFSLVAIYLGRRAAGATPPAHVPPRFGLGSILVMLTAYGVLFAGLRLVDTPPVGHLLAGLFVFLVGLAQWRLTNPLWARLVSVATGVGCFWLTFAVAYAWLPRVERDALGQMWLELAGLSAVIGYAAGGAVAAIFLVMNGLDTWWRADERTNTEPHDSATQQGANV